jgi:hypothetical protein
VACLGANAPGNRGAGAGQHKIKAAGVKSRCARQVATNRSGKQPGWTQRVFEALPLQPRNKKAPHTNSFTARMQLCHTTHQRHMWVCKAPGGLQPLPQLTHRGRRLYSRHTRQAGRPHLDKKITAAKTAATFQPPTARDKPKRWCPLLATTTGTVRQGLQVRCCCWSCVAHPVPSQEVSPHLLRRPHCRAWPRPKVQQGLGFEPGEAHSQLLENPVGGSKAAGQPRHRVRQGLCKRGQQQRRRQTCAGHSRNAKAGRVGHPGGTGRHPKRLQQASVAAERLHMSRSSPSRQAHKHTRTHVPGLAP